jgi:hypothetical protein
MPDARLEEIQARADAATLGPWRNEPGSSGPDNEGNPWPADYVAAAGIRRRFQVPTVADAAFIAHARQDVPDLLAEVELLRNDNAALVSAAQIYLDSLDADPENEFVSLVEAPQLTFVREAVERWDRRNA